MKNLVFALSVSLLFVSCSKKMPFDTNQSPDETVQPSAASSNSGTGSYKSDNGRAGVMEAYYDDQLFNINFYQLSDNAARRLLVHNKSVNEIYMMDDPLPGGAMFVAVIDAIQGDGYNPLWQEVQVHFNPGFIPHQFLSDTDIDNAASGSNPEIRLEDTGEVYRCAVIGPH